MAIDSLGFILIAIFSFNFLSVGIKVEPVVLFFLIQGSIKSGFNLIINYMKLSPSGNLCAIISGTTVIHTVNPSFIVGNSLAALINPAPKHLALVIEGVLLAIDGL